MIQKNEITILAIVLAVVLLGEWMADQLAQRPFAILVILAIGAALAYRWNRRKSRR